MTEGPVQMYRISRSRKGIIARRKSGLGGEDMPFHRRASSREAAALGVSREMQEPADHFYAVEAEEQTDDDTPEAEE